MEETNRRRRSPMVYVHVNETEQKILARLITDARRPHELAEYPEFDVTRQYINTRMIRMKDLGWAENRMDGLYGITPLGRRKFAELDDTEVHSLAEFLQIYGPGSLEAILTRMDDYMAGDVGADDIARDLEIRSEHLEVAVKQIADRLNGDTDHIDITSWIASADEVDEASERVEREQAASA